MIYTQSHILSIHPRGTILTEHEHVGVQGREFRNKILEQRQKGLKVHPSDVLTFQTLLLPTPGWKVMFSAYIIQKPQIFHI